MESLLIVALALIVLLAIILAQIRANLARREFELTVAKRERGQELAKQREWMEALASTTSLGLVLLDVQGRVTFLNDAAQILLGVGDALGKPLVEIAWGFDLQSSVDYVLKQHNELVHQTIVQGERAFAATLTLIRKENPTGVLVELVEVTELQRLGRARREFVANISHELRTPLTSLLLLMDTMTEQRLGDRFFVHEFMGKMRLQIDLLRQLTDELMDLALIESGQAPIKLVETNAADLTQQVADALRPQAERKGLALEVSVPGDLLILADAQAIRKVLSNLMHNAIKFTPPGGCIQVRAAASGDNVEFAVQDTGVGIPASDLPRVFERFYKVDRSRTRTSGELHGTGLGLAIAKHVVSAHGGSIWAISTEGQGSTFYFTVPLAS